MTNIDLSVSLPDGPSTPDLIQLIDDINEARDLVHVLEMATADLDGDDGSALCRVIGMISTKLSDVAVAVEEMREQASPQMA